MRLLLILLVVVAGCRAQEYTGVVGSGPQIVKQPLDKIFNVDSSYTSVYLDCEADGDERPTYTWEKDDTLIDLQSNPRYQLARGRLTITEPDRMLDAGTYQCFPSNQIGKIMSNKAKLEFAYVGIFPETGPADMEIAVNTGVCISCEPPENYPGLQVSWFKSQIPVLPNERMHTTKDGRLCFANFLASDAEIYICYITNIIGAAGASTAVKYSDTFSVNAGEAADNSEHGPEVADPVIDQEVLVNREETILYCFFFGNPVPSLTWRRKSPAGASIPVNSENRLNNQQLILKNIQVDDAGEYECVTEDGQGRSAGNIVVRVPPTWVTEIADINGNIYDDLTLECEAESPDGVAYKWFRNAEELFNRPRHQISNGLKRLTIQNLTVEDTGMYQCAANNAFGEIYTTAQLTVLAIKPWFEVQLQMNQPAPRGGSVKILCQPKAAPTPTIAWTKGSQTITSNGHYTIMDDGTLMITDITDADGGEYTCTATNSQGVGASTGSLVIRDGTAMVEPPTNLMINEGDMGILTCRASHDPLFELQYVWMKEGTQVDLRLPNYEQPQIQTGETSQLMIKDATMDLGGEYTCTAITSIDEVSASATVTIRGRPGPPAGISVVVTAQTANVSWSHGSDNNSPILFYSIEGSTNHVPEWSILRNDIPMDSTHIRITGLSAWSTYKFRVIAVNEVGRGEPSEESDEQATAEDRPTQVPSNIGGGGGNDGDLRITWDPLPSQEWNAPDLSYKIFWREQDSQEDFQEALVEDPETGVYVASGVPAYKPFEVQIQVENIRGPGPRTGTVLVYSFQRSPEEPPTSVTAKAVSSSEVQVSWIGINAENIVGELEGYKITYWTTDSTEELGRIERVPGSETKRMIINLEPNTMYNLNVRAYSGGGDGPPSTETTSVMTLKQSPMQKPADVVLKTKGSTSITVKWNPITTSSSEEPLTGYKILYWPQGNLETDAQVEKVDKTTSQITIDGLKASTKYFVKVRGYSSGGDGVTSDAQSITTDTAGNKLPRGSASSVTQSVLLVLLPFLVAFHLR